MRVKQLGRYTLDRRIGEGGVAKVYRAHDPADKAKTPVVIKVGEATDEKDFLKEANILRRLEHPNIVRIIDYGKEKKKVFIVMEYVRGVDLHALMKAGGKLPLGLAAMVAKAIAAALATAHALKDDDGSPLNIVHRDVTPTNVLLSEEGHVLLADFGTARWDLSEVATGTGIIKGKYEYLAPEQASGERVTQSADLYALGLVMFEMLSGKRAYDANNAFDMIELAASGILLSAKDTLPKETHALLPIVERLLKKDISERYANAAQARDAIEAAVRVSDAERKELAARVKRAR